MQPITANSPALSQRPLLRLVRPGSASLCWIKDGKQGSLQTAAEMARLVREDTVKDEGLQKFAAGLLLSAGLDSHSNKDEILDTVFRFVQRVPYISDPSGSFDAVNSARQVLRNGFGDCDDLSVLLATLLALIGFRPEFVLARYHENAKGFDHIYVSVETDAGRVALDPTSRTYGVGWENPKAIDKVSFPIFGVSPGIEGLGTVSPALLTGAQVGLSFVPVVGPLLAAAVAPVAALFNRDAQRAEETQRDSWVSQVYSGMSEIQRAVDSCQLTPAQGVAAANELRDRFYQACDGFKKKSVGASCRNFEIQDTPGGAQQGGIRTHTQRIATAGANCRVPVAVTGSGITSQVSGNAATGASATGQAVGGADGLAVRSDLSTALLLIGGGLLAMKLLKG